MSDSRGSSGLSGPIGPPSPPSAPGDLCGRYRLIEALGKGGMAEVFLAEPVDGRGPVRVAIKRLLPHFAADRRFVDMMRDEAHIARAIRHPNVAAVFDVGEAGGRPYLAMEYVDGVDLGRVLRAYRKAGRRMPLAAVLMCCHRAALGLGAAHALVDAAGRSLEVVHRDVSPHNMLVGRDGTVKIIDFGVAKAASNSSRTRSGVIKGKLQYMSPEQARAENLDARADLFSLGMSLFKMLTGRLPFEGANEYQIYDQILRRDAPTPRRDVPDLPPRVEALVLRSLRKARERRFQTAHEMAELLALALREVDPDFDEAALARELARLLTEHAGRPRTPEDEDEDSPASSPAVDVAPMSDAAIDQYTFAVPRTRVERRTRVVAADELGNVGAVPKGRSSLTGAERPSGPRGTAVAEVAPADEVSSPPRAVPVARPAWGPAVATVDALVSEPAPDRISRERAQPGREAQRVDRATDFDATTVPTVPSGSNGRIPRLPAGRDTPSGARGGVPSRASLQPLAIPVPGLLDGEVSGPVSLPALYPPTDASSRARSGLRSAHDDADLELPATMHVPIHDAEAQGSRGRGPAPLDDFHDDDATAMANFGQDGGATSALPAVRAAIPTATRAARPNRAPFRSDQATSDPSLPAAELAESALRVRRPIAWWVVGALALALVAGLSALWVIQADDRAEAQSASAGTTVLPRVTPSAQPSVPEVVSAVPGAMGAGQRPAGAAASAEATPAAEGPDEVQRPGEAAVPEPPEVDGVEGVGGGGDAGVEPEVPAEPEVTAVPEPGDVIGGSGPSRILPSAPEDEDPPAGNPQSTPSVIAKAPTTAAPAKQPTRRIKTRPAARAPRKAQKQGKLTVNALPWAHVEVDGRRLTRNTPIQGMLLPVGSHRITLISPDGETHSATVEITTEREARVVHRFK